MNWSPNLLQDPNRLAIEIVRLADERGIDLSTVHKITRCSAISKYLKGIGQARGKNLQDRRASSCVRFGLITSSEKRILKQKDSTPVHRNPYLFTCAMKYPHQPHSIFPRTPGELSPLGVVTMPCSQCGGDYGPENPFG